MDTLSEEPEVAILCGWGDMTHFMRAGIPTVGIGASYPGAPHSAREKVKVSDMVNCTRATVVCVSRFLQKK
ncbi:MAG: hypothetical protein IJC34_02545 [Lentisphaeria bacterium]|nr:hypothetical protein [Lentisphaeria bacterium]